MDPDKRLKSFNNKEENKLVDDLWMIHEDGVHFDLKKKKESALATRELIYDSVDDIETKELNDDKSEGQSGPGYMGWRISDNVEKITENVSEICEREKFTQIEIRIRDLEKLESENKKEISEMRKDMKKLKEEYKQCMEALEKETYDKNQAEVLCKVLREKIGVEKDLEVIDGNADGNEEKTDEDMSVDEDDSWKEQTRPKRKRKQVQFNQCEDCNMKFKSEQDVKEHILLKHTIEWEQCHSKYKTKEELNKHLKSSHTGTEYKCEQCDSKLKTKGDLNRHIKDTHGNQINSLFPCMKCDHVYNTMTELRRHDWRCHRVM